jgi:flagellar M-ring protein FliF
MSLAVLVDQDVTWEKDKTAFQRVLVPPTPEKLKVIRDLVAGITGFSPDRGDQLVIETLPFENTLLLEPPLPPNAGVPGKPGAPVAGFPIPLTLDRKTLLMGGGALGGLLLLGIVVSLFRRKGRRASGGSSVSTPASLPAAASASSAALAAPGQVENQMESQLAERDALQAKADAQALSSLKLAPVITKKAEVFAKHLRDKIAKEPEISVQILRGWIREEEEN